MVFVTCKNNNLHFYFISIVQLYNTQMLNYKNYIFLKYTLNAKNKNI